VVKVDRRIRWHYTTTILRLRIGLVHDSRGIKLVNFTILLALSAGTLMASAGTPYRLVPVITPVTHHAHTLLTNKDVSLIMRKVVQ